MLSFNQIMKELEQKKYRPIYLLMGEETFFIDQIVNFIEQNVLPEKQKTFNQIVLYGRDTDAVSVIEYARRFPMMSEKFVVIIKEAQNLKKLEKIRFYAEKPLKSTILVLAHKYKKAPAALVKAIEKAGGAVLEAKKLYENKIPDWIISYLSEKGYKIQIEAIRLLIENIGSELSKLANELDKLMLILPKNTTITSEVIEKNIGVSKEYNVFELQKALAYKNIEKVYKIIWNFAQNPKNNPLIMVLASLYRFFSKILLVHSAKNYNDSQLAELLKVHKFFIKEYKQAALRYPLKKLFYIFNLLREYDLKAKGVHNVGTTEGELLKELIFKILH